MRVESGDGSDEVGGCAGDGTVATVSVVKVVAGCVKWGGGDCILILIEHLDGRLRCAGSGPSLDLSRRREMRTRHAEKSPRHLYFRRRGPIFLFRGGSAQFLSFPY